MCFDRICASLAKLNFLVDLFQWSVKQKVRVLLLRVLNQMLPVVLHKCCVVS